MPITYFATTTPNRVFDTFPWPQNPTPEQVKAVALAGRALHEYRRDAMVNNPRLTLRDLYRTLELPGKNPLKDLHATLDSAVLAAYGFDSPSPRAAEERTPFQVKRLSGMKTSPRQMVWR